MVIDLAEFDFAFFLSFQDGISQRAGGGSKGYFSDCKGFIINFFNLCSNLHGSAAGAVVIAADVDESARREVRIERKFLAAKIGNAGVKQLIEVMRQNL